MIDDPVVPAELAAFGRLVRRRRMVRAFADRAVASELVDGLCDLARRAPSAGNTQAVRFLVLEGNSVGGYWDVTMPEPEARARFRWPGLLVAPALVLAYVDVDAYPARYGEPDKAATGLGAGADAWPVPYWWVDGGAAVEHLLLGATAAGLGACLFGQFGHEPALRAAFGVPEAMRALGTIALGWPAPDAPGRSAGRARPPLAAIVHRGRWPS